MAQRPYLKILAAIVPACLAILLAAGILIFSFSFDDSDYLKLLLAGIVILGGVRYAFAWRERRRQQVIAEQWRAYHQRQAQQHAMYLQQLQEQAGWHPIPEEPQEH